MNPSATRRRRADHDRRPPAAGRAAVRAWPRTSAPASPARSRSSRRATSTTSAARSCSRRSPSCPSTTRPAPSARSSSATPPEICAAAGKPDDADRARLGLGGARPACCSTRCARPAACETYAPVDISEEITREHRGGCRLGVRDHRPRPRLRLRARPRAHAARGAAGDRLPRRHDRQLRAGASAPASCARIANLLGPDDRFLLGTDLVKDRERARGRLQRLRRGHRRVQQERAQRPQPRARRRLRPRRVRARRLLGRREPLGRHPPALARQPGRSTSPRST